MKCPLCEGSGEITAEQGGTAAVVAGARKQAGLTQQQLADAVGLSRTSIANIESGRHQIPASDIRKFASALHIEPLELLP